MIKKLCHTFKKILTPKGKKYDQAYTPNNTTSDDNFHCQ